jgi:hypothetical protein
MFTEWGEPMQSFYPGDNPLTMLMTPVNTPERQAACRPVDLL